jgi:uncharacterized membrane protein YbhN (UPF0104 family)
MNQTANEAPIVRHPATVRSGFIRILTQWLPIIAFLAAALYLWRSDLAPDIRVVSVPLLVAASALQTLAFAMRAWLLRNFLARVGIRLTSSATIVCIFKPILSKYIPGKIWLLVTTAGILDSHGVPFRRASFLVGIFQVILAVTGLALGAIALLAFQLPGVQHEARLTMIFVPLTMFALLLGSNRFSHWLLARLPKRRAPSGALSTLPSLSVTALYSVAHWLVLGLAFAFFFRAVGIDAGWYPVFFQPLAINLGVLAVIVPGGLGVREGAMAAYLTLVDIAPAHGLALAVAARVWFFAGEVLAFFLGFLLESRARIR